MGNLQSNPSSSTQIIEKKYEVFLNFRGVDTRDGFTNYLYEALLRKSIETFMDEAGIERGEEIWSKLSKTIRDSMIFVVIFSKEYASSKWCLRELVEILKSGRTVIPVFYKVTVHDVRHQEGSFKDGFDQLEKEFRENLDKKQVDSANVEKRKIEFYDEMQEWRQALEGACHLKGQTYEKGLESEFIDKIVKDIWEKLMRACKLSPCDFKGLFGFEKRFKQVMSLLSLDNADIRIIGIWGMGGIGKTTIADAIFHQISYDEYGKCFIQNVRQRLEQCGGLVSELQQEVLSKVLNDQDIKLDGVSLPEYIKRRLYQKKLFIVLDDVDNFFKLEKLAGGLDRLNPGSRIIITTRNKEILRNCQVNDDYIYEVKRLSDEEAQKLFCKYAFRQSPLTKDLMALSHEILQAINGNPLGLKVAGSSLLRLNELKWQSALNRLKKSSQILEVLQISYDGLEEEDRHAFLDIACFFVGEHEDFVAEILDNSESLEVLSDRSLITISDDKIIEMHDLLQEMGREIVRKEDCNNPGHRSRLWTQEDVLDRLNNGDGTNAIRGISLNMPQLNEENLSSQAFEKMTNLIFLKFYDDSCWYSRYEMYGSNGRFPNGISYLSNKLRSLNWFGYPLKALPSNFNPKYLVELNLSHSNIEKLWEKNTHAPKLKWIILKVCPYLIKVSDILHAPLLQKIDIHDCDNFLGFPSGNHFPALKYLHLSSCNNLTWISDLLDAPSLEKIDIQDCENLLYFPPPVRHFNNLCELNLSGCKNLQSFPNNISLSSLVSLDLSGCINLARISNVLDAPLLEKIDLCHCKRLLDFPPPVHHFNSLRELNLRDCKNLQSFPNNVSFPSLVSLDLSSCINFARILDFLDAPLLEKINLNYCKSLLNFPQPVHHFKNLRELNMRDCKNLQSFPNNISLSSLVSLDLCGCINLARISDVLDAPLLEKIDLCHCKSLLDIPPPVHHFNSLRELNLRDCKNLQSFPNNISFPSLVSLDLSGCINIAWISDFLDAPLLEKINLNYCKSLINFPPPVHHFNNLRELNMRDCKNLQSFPKNIHFPSLVSFDLSRCINLAKISDVLDAPLLETVNLLHCKSLLDLPPPVHHFSNLRKLNLRDCKNLQSFPNNISFPSLTSLDLSGCINLARISDVLDAPLLEKIDLFHCKSLLDFPTPIDHFNNLRELNLRNCKNLRSFPNNISFPSLLSLDLSMCINLARISDFLVAPLLENINLYSCSALLEFPSPVDRVFDNHHKSNMKNCNNLKSLGKNIHFPSLISVNLSGCHSVTGFSDLLDASLLEPIIRKDCSSLCHFPTPSQHFNNLYHLNLENCKNLQSFPSDIHFLSLAALTFSGCCNLKMFPNISGNITTLSMSRTAIDEVPSTIENLPELVELDLTKCTRLKLISTSICKLKALRKLHLSNCFALKCFPEILDAMGNLKLLDLEGTAIKGLHHSIENLSGLEMLCLQKCRKLEMLPISIYNLASLTFLNLSGCLKLKKLPENSVINLSNCGKSATTKPPSWGLDESKLYRLYFTDCLKLNKTAVVNIMKLQINQLRDMTTKECGAQAVHLRFFYPGSEVPGWFNCQTDGSSINIQMSGHDGVNGHLIGFAPCAVIEGYYFNFDISYRYRCHCKNHISWPHSLRINSVDVHYANKTLTDHVALWYSNASFLEQCDKCTNYLFEFNLIRNENPNCRAWKKYNCRVKYCGVCPIYEKHNITLPSIANETCGAADQDSGETSIKEQGKIRKFSDEPKTSGMSNEDVIEPHPKRTCS